MRPTLDIHRAILPEKFPENVLSLEGIKTAKMLSRQLRSSFDPHLPEITKLNVLLASDADLKEEGLGSAETSFARLLHAWVCAILEKNWGDDAKPKKFLFWNRKKDKEDAKRNDLLLKALRKRFCVPYELLDHHDRARFAYDARDYLRIQGLIIPEMRRFMEKRDYRILFTGRYTFAIKKGKGITDATLLHLDISAEVFDLDKDGLFSRKNKHEDLKLIAIGPYAFYCMDELSQLGIPPTVQEIGECAFSQCYGLQRLYTRQGIKSPPVLRAKAFNDCESLYDIRTVRPDLYPKLSRLNLDGTGLHQLWSFCRNRFIKGSQKGNKPNVEKNHFERFGAWRCFRLIQSQKQKSQKQEFPQPFFWAKFVRTDQRTPEEYGMRRIAPSSQLGMYWETRNRHVFAPSQTTTDFDKIEDYAFSEKNLRCYFLQKIDFVKAPQLRRIGVGAFGGCRNLEHVDLSGTSITRLEAFTFFNCEKLEDVRLPISCSFIAPSAFGNCPALRKITYGESQDCPTPLMEVPTGNPVSLWSGGYRILLRYFNNPKKNESTNSEENEITRLLEKYPCVCIGDYAFEHYVPKASETIQIPEGVTHIRRGAFQCTPKEDAPTTTKLPRIELPATLHSIGAEAFAGQHVHFYVNEKNPYFEVLFDDPVNKSTPATDTDTKAGTFNDPVLANKHAPVLVTKGPGNRTLIAASGWGMKENDTKNFDISGICNILAGACSYSAISQVTNVAELRTIGQNAFRECKKLERLPFEEASKLRHIGRNAFKNCEGLKQELDLPRDVEFLGDFAFSGCKQLSTVTANRNLRWLGDGCFYGCESLNIVNLSSANRLTIIPRGAFSECSQLEKIELPNSIKRIEKDAFRCKPRDKVPSDDKSIGPIIFLPASLRVIEGEAFAGRRSWSFVVDEKNPIYSTCYPLPQGNADPDPFKHR